MVCVDELAGGTLAGQDSSPVDGGFLKGCARGCTRCLRASALRAPGVPMFHTSVCFTPKGLRSDREFVMRRLTASRTFGAVWHQVPAPDPVYS
jgi:hypothetical protein